MQSREYILGIVREDQVSLQFVPGEAYIQPAGKIVVADDRVNLIDASLDKCLTSGRYAHKLELKLAYSFERRFSSMTVSRSSAASQLAFSAHTSPKMHDKKNPQGSEVLTVAASFPATVRPIVQNGCIWVFVNVD